MNSLDLSPFPAFPEWFDGLERSADAVPLNSDQIQAAADLSQRYTAHPQWHLYQAALAQFGFEQWLHDRAPEITVDTTQSSLHSAAWAIALPVAHGVRVGHTTLCIVPLAPEPDAVWPLPRAVLALAALQVDYYVMVGVNEADQEAIVFGFRAALDFNTSLAQSAPLIEQGWTHECLWEWIDTDLGRLLTILRREPVLVASANRPSVPPVPQWPSAIWTQLQHQRPLWQILSWEQGYRYLLPDQDRSSPPLGVNVGQWLAGQLDEAMQRLGWILLPPVMEVSGFRSSTTLPTPDLTALLAAISRQGIALPPTARGAMQTLQFGNFKGRLYGFMTPLPQSSTEYPSALHPWRLLLIVAPELHHPFPAGSLWQITNASQMLVSEPLAFDSSQADSSQADSSQAGSYHYVELLGDEGDEFQVSFILPGEPPQTLPPFRFQPLPSV